MEYTTGSETLDTMQRWQNANDKRVAAMSDAHNGLNASHNAHIDNYNRHLQAHATSDEFQRHAAHTINQNAAEQRQHTWLIIGAIALAAFALGRTN